MWGRLCLKTIIKCQFESNENTFWREGDTKTKTTTYGVYSVLYLLIFWENLDINILSNKKEPPLGQIVVFVPIALQIQKMPPLQSCAMHKCATKIQLEIRFHCRRLTTFSVFGVRKTRPVSGIKTLFYKAKSS